MMIDFRSKFVSHEALSMGRYLVSKAKTAVPNSAWGKWYFCTFTVGKMSLTG